MIAQTKNAAGTTQARSCNAGGRHRVVAIRNRATTATSSATSRPALIWPNPVPSNHITPTPKYTSVRGSANNRINPATSGTPPAMTKTSAVSPVLSASTIEPNDSNSAPATLRRFSQAGGEYWPRPVEESGIGMAIVESVRMFGVRSARSGADSWHNGSGQALGGEVDHL